MSHLLSANIDVGLKYALDMGYCEDLKTRASFMDVLTNTLRQGTEFDDLGENSLQNKYEKLLQLLFEKPYELLHLWVESCPVDDLDECSDIILSIFEEKGLELSLLEFFIQWEVELTGNY